MGEEEFYIDNITNLFIDHVLSEEEKQFNLNVLYGKESSVDQIISICKKKHIRVGSIARNLDEVKFLKKNQSTYIPLGSKHRLSNPGKISLTL